MLQTTKKTTTKALNVWSSQKALKKNLFSFLHFSDSSCNQKVELFFVLPTTCKANCDESGKRQCPERNSSSLVVWKTTAIQNALIWKWIVNGFFRNFNFQMESADCCGWEFFFNQCGTGLKMEVFNSKFKNNDIKLFSDTKKFFSSFFNNKNTANVKQVQVR